MQQSHFLSKKYYLVLARFRVLFRALATYEGLTNRVHSRVLATSEGLTHRVLSRALAT